MTTQDVCARVQGPWLAQDPMGNFSYLGDVDDCLCINGIPAFLEDNPLAAQSALQFGLEQTEQILVTFLATANLQICIYPPHAFGICENHNPCNFGCTSGFIASPFFNPTHCACPPPKVVCGDSCIVGSCPSSAPNKKRDVSSADFDWFRGAQCDQGHTPCGIFNGPGKGWDCIDTESDLESCGGCSIPLHAGSPAGTDCSAIAGVDDVECSFGECVINSCTKGWKLSEDEKSCIQENVVRGLLS